MIIYFVIIANFGLMENAFVCKPHFLQKHVVNVCFEDNNLH